MSNRFIPEREAPVLPVARAMTSGPKLFTPEQVAIATFLGSPIAGGVVLALSHRRAKTGRGWLPLMIGIALTIASFTIGMMLPDGVGYAIPFAGLFAMRQLARSQMPAIEAAAGTSSSRASTWSAVGISLGFLVMIGAVVFGLIVAGVVMTEPPGVAFGPDEVQYDHGATATDAQLVGGYLEETGFFTHQGTGKTVRVGREHGEVVVSFVLKKLAWDKELVRDAFRGMLPTLGQRFNGAHVVIHLCDDTMDNQRTIE